MLEYRIITDNDLDYQLIEVRFEKVGKTRKIADWRYMTPETKQSVDELQRWVTRLQEAFRHPPLYQSDLLKY